VSARLRRALFAVALATGACNAILGNEADVTYVDDDAGLPGALPDGEVDGALAADAGDGDGQADALPDAQVAVCSDADAAFCADFDPPYGPPAYGFSTATDPAPTTTGTTFTTPPFSLDVIVSAADDAPAQFVQLTTSSAVVGSWEFDVQVLEVPSGAAPGATIFELLCKPDELVRLALVDSTVYLQSVDFNSGTVHMSHAGPTLSTPTWTHLSVDVGTSTVVLRVNGAERAFVPQSCSSPIRVSLGTVRFSGGPAGGRWRILFDSFRHYE
jgi:hypothetical protein